MRKDKNKAIELRSKGKSYSEISRVLIVPKSTLSEWFKKYPWSKEIGRNLVEKSKQKSKIILKELNNIRGNDLSRLYLQAEKEANEDFEVLKYHPLFISAMMIYWGEGDKRSKNRISVTNTEPAMLKIFIYFLKNMCSFPEDKIRAWILAYPDMDIEKTKLYWIKNTGLKESNFRKTIVIKGKSKINRLTYGVCTVELGSTYFKIKMLVWLRRFSEVLVTNEYYAGVV